MQEAKALLEKLLAFEVEGNFPLYLHEFPRCADTQLSSRILPVFFYLLRDFPAVLGETLFIKLQKVAKDVVLHLEKQTLSLPAKARLLAFQGRFLQDMWKPETVEQAAQWCLCSQMTGQSIDAMAQFWDPNLCVFVGPCKERWQEGFEPMVSLLDLFMGEYYKQFSARAINAHLVHLQAALVYPFSDAPIKQEAASFKALIAPEKKQCFTLYFGDENKTHSLVCEAKKGKWEIVEEEKNRFLLCYGYEETLPGEEEAVEFALYLDADPAMQILVGSQKATVFHSHDCIHVFVGEKKLQIQFQAENGVFMGHISQADRSLQKKQDLCTSYDWKLGFRTVQRPLQAEAFIRIDCNL
jgi:hypothetical protein